MSKPTLPKLLRQVRKAVAGEDYALAESLYRSILEFPEMADDLDIRLRHAFCAEKSGHIDQAVDDYSKVLSIYHKQGEKGAAASLELVIEELKKGPETVASDPVYTGDAERITALNDAELMRSLINMGERITLLPGDTLCCEGDMPATLWLLHCGDLTVELPGDDEPDMIHTKEGHVALIGELALFTGQRRVSTVEAATTAELSAIKTSKIDEQQRCDPAFRLAMKRLLFERWVEPVLTRQSVFERINYFDRMRVVNCFEQISLGPGETLIKAGEVHDHAYLLQSGCMFFMHPTTLSMEQRADAIETDDGLLISTVFSGDMIHLGGLLKGYRSDYKIVTATPVRLLRLSQEVFEPFSLKRPWIIQAILRFSRRSSDLQVVRSDDDYIRRANRHVKVG